MSKIDKDKLKSIWQQELNATMKELNQLEASTGYTVERALQLAERIENLQYKIDKPE